MSATSTPATTRTIIEAAVVVPAPQNEAVLERLGIPAKARVIHDLEMRSSSRGFPDPLEEWENPANLKLKPEGWWLSEDASFVGNASTVNAYQELSAPEPVSANNATAAFCVTKDGRLLAVISPNVASEASVWIGTTCSRVKVALDGDSKTAALTIASEDWTVYLGDVSRLYRSIKEKNHTAAKAGAALVGFGLTDILILPSGGKRGPELNGRYQTEQTRSLIEAISNGAKTPASYELAKPDGPALGEGYRWIKDQGLGGLYRLERKCELTTATSLVDQELPVADQIDALEKNSWVPRAMVNRIIEQTRDGTLPKVFIPRLPAGRVNQPLNTVYFGVIIGDEPASHAVSRYMWPSLSHGALKLDEGEELLFERQLTRAKLSHLSSTETAASGQELGSKGTTEARVYVTNQRVVAVAKRSRDGVPADDKRRWWASHFRHEWIYEVGTHEETPFKRTLVRAKPKDGTTSVAPFIRVMQVHGVHELLFIGLDDRSFISDVVNAVNNAGVGREVTEAHAEHEAMFFRTKRASTRISNAVPYSLRLGLAS
jgi:hypothetical protein